MGRRWVAVVLAICGLFGASTARIQTTVVPGFGQPHIRAVPSPLAVLPNVKIVNYGEVIYQGSIDVNAEVDRIRRGEARNHRNDGGVFSNRERLLPATERGAYREFVYVQRGIPFPGPARLVISRTGDVWFTGDHYSSFIRVPRANRSSTGGQQ